MRKFTTGIAVAATAALAMGATAPAQAAPAAERKAGDRSLAAVLAKDGAKLDKNWKDFDILEQGVLAVLEAKPNSPVKVLTQGGKRVTAFLPTDAAFRALVKDLTGKQPKTEKATLKTLTSVADAETLESVLLYHVVVGKTLTSPKVVKADGMKIKTANGMKVGIKVQGKKVWVTDLDKNDRDARVIKVDINKGNKQIGHAVDRVLRPLDL